MPLVMNARARAVLFLAVTWKMHLAGGQDVVREMVLDYLGECKITHEP